MANIIILTEDILKLCRTCLGTGALNPLQQYVGLLKNLVSYDEVTIDNLPPNICNSCQQFLENINSFIETFRNNDTYLKELLKERKLKIVVDKCTESSIQYSEDRHGSEEDFVELKNYVRQNPENCMNKEDGDEYEENIKSEKDEPQQTENANKTKKKRIEECSCSICGNKFTRLGGLKRHMKIHMGIKPFKCKICEKTFVEKATLARHNLIHSDEKPFECNLCGKMSRRKDQIIEHLQKQHPNATDINMFVTEREKIDTTEIKVEELPALENKSEIVQLESEARTFKTKKRIEICLCNLCGKIFRRREYLKNHMAIHAKIKPFKCEICGKSFTQRHVLTRHNLVHTKERPFQCNLCGRTFTRKEILTEHISNHDGAKRHLCFHCGKCFSNKYYLAKHLRYYLTGNKIKNPDNKKCNCPHCGKQLHSTSYLKTHLLTHTGEKPFECSVCRQKFTTQQTLNHHLNIHKGIKPYQCTQCGKSFRTSNSLQKHNLLHTGERPFKCVTCDKGFIRRSHLKRHFRTH